MADDENSRKFETLQQYIPFLENMISQLKDPCRKNREQQLSKMESLHAMITDRKKKLKLETLNKCEDVITKLYQKVNHKPFPAKNEQSSSTPQYTPASPSPPPEPKDFHRPRTIPTERLEPESFIPKVDIYNSAAESLRQLNNREQSLPGKVPDLSKPPISLDDLKCLEVDVQEKINENASLKELNDIRNKIATELIFENIKSMIKTPENSPNFDDSSSNSQKDTINATNNCSKSTHLNEKNNTNQFECLATKPKPVPKLLNESQSIFGKIMSNIDEQILEETKKKLERRTSIAKEDHSTIIDENKKKKKDPIDDKKTKDIIFRKHSEDLNVPKKPLDTDALSKSHENKKADIHTGDNKDVIIIDDEIGSNISNKVPSKIVNRNEIQGEPIQSPQYKRLADKYNPKPRKPAVDADVIKRVSDSIEANMKYSPPKLPIINKPEPPPPPPASLVKCAQQIEFEFQNKHASGNLNINPSPLINSLIQRPPLLNNPHSSPSVLLSPRDNFISDYAREDFTLNHRRSHFEAPHLPKNRFILNNPNQRFNLQFNNFNQNSRDPAPPLLDFQPPANVTSHQFNVGPPLLSPETPHFHEQKHNYGGIMNREMFLPKEDLRWRLEDSRPSWEWREYHDPRFRGPMTYKQHREMRENSRDPRLARDSRDNREPLNVRDFRETRENKERDPREHRENRDRESAEDTDIRDPRLNKDKFRVKEIRERENKDILEKSNRDPRLQKDVDRQRGRSRNRYESKFDRIYSSGNKKSGSNSRPTSESTSSLSAKEKDTFMSPLDSLYSGKEKHKTGKGYGFQTFRIPKKKKEEKDQAVNESTNVQDDENICGNESPTFEKETDQDNSNSNNKFSALNEENKAEKNIERNAELTKKGKDTDNTVSASDAQTTSNLEDNTNLLNRNALDTDSVEKVKSLKDNITEPQTSEKVEESKPVTEQTILAQFFSNLLSSQNKKDKKTALYSLISTFSDTFSSKELAKITKIINANKEEGEHESDDDNEDSKQDKSKTEAEKLKNTSDNKSMEQIEKLNESAETIDENESEEIIPLKTSKCRVRSRRISSSSPIKEQVEDTKSIEPSEVSTNEDNETDINQVFVSVGERIKSRKRKSLLDKPKKKCRSELDKLHEDIQEMFIRDGVLTASGKRMCNLLKDDPSVLTSEPLKANEEALIKTRKKPRPKSKIKSPNEIEVKTMKNVRVMIHKIPDNAVEESSLARRLTRSMTVADQEGESAGSDKEYTDKAASDKDDSDKEDSDEVENETSDNEKDSTSPSLETQKTKGIKRKRLRSSWASGVIKKKKKKQQTNIDDLPPPKTPDSEQKSTKNITPVKDYFVNFASQKAYACNLCDFQGKFITTHYKTVHHESEVMSSRLSPTHAAEAITDSENNLGKYETSQYLKPSAKIHYVCRFCEFTSSIVPTSFYDHLTTHTGEYRHMCPNCESSFCNGKTLKYHMKNSHAGDERPIVRKSYNSIIHFGYLCAECNYVQINKTNVEKHVNTYHGQKATIYKINLSSHFDENIENYLQREENIEDVRNSLDLPSQAELKSDEIVVSTHKKSIDNKESATLSIEKKEAEVELLDTKVWKDAKNTSKNKRHVRAKPAPKSKKKLTAASKPTVDEESSPLEVNVSISKLDKPKISRGDVLLDTEKILPFKSKRAAKEKAQKKLKVFMEMNDSSTKRKSISDENKMTTEAQQEKDSNLHNKSKALESVSSIKNTEVENDSSRPEGIKEVKDVSFEGRKENLTKIIKKEVDMNVFTCNTDIQEENKQIEQERLQKMEELNKAFGSRTSLNFTDKLCTRLNQNDILVKQEPTDEFVDKIYQSVRNKSPVPMPVLEKSALITPTSQASSQVKKPLLESIDSHVSTAPTFDVAQKNDKNIMNMIEKLKGKLEAADDSFKLDETESDEFDNSGPPPLTHVNELTNIKPSDASAKTLEICGLLKMIRTDESTTFSCLMPPCVFSSDNKDQFQMHCKENHSNGVPGRTSTLCETCGMEINTTTDSNLLENLFNHAISLHNDFIKNEYSVKPPNRMLRIRKLSGDALSVVKKSEEEDIKVENEKDANEAIDNKDLNEKSCETPMEFDPDKSLIVTEPVEDNPFPFKISGVMSLAEPNQQPPPLTPILKQMPIVVKEAKLTAAEMAKARKAPKAMAKFIQDVGNLYKCPYYFCMFSTNFRDFLERHLKAHNSEKDDMIPCVYCHLKTPWEHVAIHIDIRHSNCKYACSYCLYRACLKNYVFLHQDRAHPYLDYSVIALPNPKIPKKFAIADVKIDPTTLCEPYKCLPGCNVEFLFENEFRQHLLNSHVGFITCGHGDCTSRVPALKMVHHWSIAHAVSIYQCGYCKINSNELNLMYHHLSQMHQNLNPEILLRIITPTPIIPLGYSAEAFKQMRIIATLPNMTDTEKAETTTPEECQELIKTTSHSVTHFDQSAQMITTTSEIQIPRTVLVSSTKLVVNNPTTSTITASSNSTYIMTNAPIGGLSGNTSIPMSLLKLNNPTGQSPSVKETPIGKQSLFKNAGQIGQPTQPTSVTVSNIQTLPTFSSESSLNVENDHVAATAPLEHVTLSEETNQDEISECDVDPLDLGDTITSQSMAYSSEEESDCTRSKKKSGLLGYQLFRCNFCDFSSSNSLDFRKHTAKSVECKSQENLSKPFICVHCKKPFKNSHVLTEHIQCHGVLRYSCSLCGNKFPTAGQARAHMKNRHSISQTTETILNPDTSLGNEEYIIKPKSVLTESAPKESTTVEFFAPAPVTVNVFNPDDIDKIPIRSIFSSDLRCGVCSYTTKVRTNLIRHLQFHSQEKAVSDSAPVNPVPCLEKNEKMFDKMINLASSSHKSGGRMGGSNKTENKDSDNIPEFIPSHSRYTCCAQGCNYICPEEANLRHHLIALHDGETCFICVHCKSQLTPTDVDNLMKHLKLHGLQLYKCQHCNFVHNLKHKVEKHYSDSHPDLPNKVITLRNFESEPINLDNAPPSGSTPILNINKNNKPWRCLMCKFRAGTEEGVRGHVLVKHEIDSQHKCALCAYKTDDKSTFSGHYKDNHPNQEIDIIHSYRKIEEETNDKEGDNFDTTPLWQRDRPRVKHIRGILFDETTLTKSPKKPNKTPNWTAGKSVARNLDLAIESVATGSDIKDENKDFIDKVNKLMKTAPISPVKQSCDIIVIDDDDDNVNPEQNERISPPNIVATKRKIVQDTFQTNKIMKMEDATELDNKTVDHDDESNLKQMFGDFGNPLNKQLKCPICNKFKSKRISDFIFHLFKEKRVYRYKCGICGDESITYRYMSKHVKEHKQAFNLDHIITMRRNPKLELWLQMLIRSQCTRIVPSLQPIQDVPYTDPTQVVCRYCTKWYKSEQEKNEHAITHWNCIPFMCSVCPFTSFTGKQVEKHLIRSHPGVSAKVLEVGPIVGKELQHADFLHMKEVEEEFMTLNGNEAGIAEVLVPATTIPNMVDESEQDGTVQGMATVNISDSIATPYEPVDNLVIVTKTDTNVPHSGDVYCCEYCPYMSNSEPIMLSHISGQHEHMHIKFKILNTRTCDLKRDDYVACIICHEVGSEIKIRQHHMNVHDGETFLFYRYTCNACCKKFIKIAGLKTHSQRVHPGVTVTYTDLFNNILSSDSYKSTKEKSTKEKSTKEKSTKEKMTSDDVLPNRNLLSVLTPSVRGWKRYQCTECSYQRDFPPSSLNNVRCHVKTHFKAFLCGECGLKFKSRTDATSHFRKDHSKMEENIIQDKDIENSFQECMRIIYSEAVPIPDPTSIAPEVKGKSTARKSTSTCHIRPMAEFSYYGNPIEEEDLNKIMTTVEINGICLDMTADKLGKIFKLDPIIPLERCDAGSDIIEIDS